MELSGVVLPLKSLMSVCRLSRCCCAVPPSSPEAEAAAGAPADPLASMSVTKETVAQHACLRLLSNKLEGYLTALSELQLSHGVAALSSAVRGEEQLARHTKVWEEMIYPFKLLAECERKYYEWSFLEVHSSDGMGGTGGGSGDSGDRRKGGSEEPLKQMYSQVGVALKKVSHLLHKFIVQHAQANLIASKLHHSASAMHMPSQALPPSASFNPHSPPASGRGGGGGGGSMGVMGGSIGGIGDTVFTGTLHIIDELFPAYISHKTSMVTQYQKLNLACAAGGGWGGGSSSGSARGFVAARVREVNYHATMRELEEARAKCEKNFTHPWMVRLRDALLLPELFLLERCMALESNFNELAILPALDWKTTMFALMRIKTEHARWTNRLMARDREGAPGGGGGASASANAAARKPAGAGGAPAKFSPLLPVTPSTLTFPCVLHWVHQLHHSLLCKATLLFWTPTAAKSAEIKGFADEAAARMERLDSNFVAQMDRIVRRLPHCYSVSLVMDCTSHPEQKLRVVDPTRPLVLRDSAVPLDDLDDGGASAIPDGMGQYPVLLSRPAHRPVLEKWNLVSLLQQKEQLAADMMAAFAAAAAARRPPPLSPHAPQQSATRIIALGPSNHPFDLLVWDYENEALHAGYGPANGGGSGGGGNVPLGTVSTFICQVDVSKSVFLVITFQAGCTNSPANATDLLSPSSASRESSGADAAALQATLHAIATAGTTPVGGSTASAASAASHASSSGGLSSPLPPSAASGAHSLQLLSAVARKRAFEQVLAEVTPMLHKLRHMHVFANLQPGLGKKRS